MKNLFCKKGLIFFSIVLLSFVICFASIKYSFKAETYEKKSFTSGDMSIITSNIYIDCNKVDVDKITFSHAQDTMFVFYISNIDKQDIDSNYIKMFESTNEITYQASKDFKIKCILNIQTNTAIIKMEEYNEELYKMIREK
ncbi:MAG: hypothetical protein J6B01_07735 [Ruminococcus sp.]|nr:hypothetical protein [Ruminococcus sp.]